MRFLHFAIITIASCIATGAAAQSQHKAVISYRVIEAPLDRVAEDLQIAGRAPITVTERSGVVVKNWEAEGTLSDVVRKLCADFGLVFAFDGVRYELTPLTAAVTVAVPLQGVRSSDVLQRLNAIYPSHSPRALTVTARSDAIVVRGSQKFVSAVKEAVAAAHDDDVSVIAYGAHRSSNPGRRPAADPASAD